MDQPSSKKRSIFGLGSLFQRSSASSEPQSKPETSIKASVPVLQRPNFNNASAPESPVKRASESQMASRKIIGRPSGPSSKLSQSVSASDLSRAQANNVVATPRRMPGDNPNKPSAFSSTTLVSRGPSTEQRSTNFAGNNNNNNSTPRSNIFRSSALYSRPAAPNFSSSRAPSNSANASFPPNTPGRTVRGSTAELLGRVPPQGTSDELFKMRIQSPPRHLTGEMLAKEVPDDWNRSGSIYADEFLTHYCPPDFTKQQRDQFFCILDLRRLKYAADEVFTKKDWRINVLNFAKEYEKSRSLIMLRYNLYEFKTVRPSEAVKKDWKEKHGIPDSDDEGEAAPQTNGARSKRKASEELTPASVALTQSVFSENKRKALEGSVKNKRKAEEEPEESQPHKLQKPAPTPQKAPSATKSMFEKIANTPAKSAPPASLFASSKNAPPASLFASSTTAKKSGGSSIFDSTPKAASTSNIFGHLSDASKNSGNEGADEDSETGSEAEDEESEMPDASASEEHTSGGEATESFAANKTVINGTSSASSDAGESAQGSAVGRSLFDRITRAPDGQPMRKLPPPESRSRSVSPVKEVSAPAPAPVPAPAAAPTNNTWNANTPIKFGGAASNSLFGQKPAAPAKETAAPAKEAPSNLFGGAAKKAEEPAAASEPAKAPSTNLFGAPAKTDGSATAAPLFGASKPAAGTGSSLFGSSTPAAAPATKVVFGDKPIEMVPDTKAVSAFDPSAMFGPQAKKVAPVGDLFAKKETPAAAETKPLTTSLFGNNAAPKPSNGNLFGAAPAATESKAAATEEPAAKKFAFGGADAKSTTSSLFGSNASTPAPEVKPAEPKNLFGASTAAAPAAETKSLFGSTTAAPATTNLFGGAATTAPASSSSLFGASTAAPAAGAKTIFGSAPATESKPLFGSTPSTESKALFGSTPAPESKPLFGSTPAPESKPLFGATPAPETKSLFGSTTTTETKPLFGNTAAADKPIFGSNSQDGKGMFGSTVQPDSKPPASLFASSATPTPAPPAPASNMFSFGGSQTPAPASQSFTFGASQAPASQPATQPAGGSIFGLGGGASFDFSVGGNSASTSFNNPFASGQDSSQNTAIPTIFSFGNSTPAPGSQSFTFGSTGNNTGASAAPVPTFSFGGASDISNAGVPPSGSGVFSFGGGSQTPSATPIFGSSLAPGGGTSTGTNTPFTFGGASSLATTPAATTPEASANVAEDGQGTNADGDDAPQEQISLTEGGRGEEDEDVVHEVRARALKLVFPDDDDESGSSGDKGAKKKGEWKDIGRGPLRLLKHKKTGSVRVLMRGEPRGHIVINKLVIPDLTYKVDPAGGKYVKMSTATDDGKGLEAWMLQVKTPDFAKGLAEALEEHKTANAKKK
ncbi:hypothetical protein QBC35DRAFT_293074 [Podospora australis]|uniref:RanBD1 domain-containing protein n=1 Tax=Podospora australis TaxID=1536484 RepID=A0AAN6X0J1_9PEZI|nr:hypothetical protein QBC35DRAFT_293074 [Podospora australis]